MGVEAGIIPFGHEYKKPQLVHTSSFAIDDDHGILVSQHPVLTKTAGGYHRADIVLQDTNGTDIFHFSDLLTDPTVPILLSDHPKKTKKVLSQEGANDFSYQAGDHILKADIKNAKDIFEVIHDIGIMNMRNISRGEKLPASPLGRHFVGIHQQLRLEHRAWWYTRDVRSKLERKYGVDLTESLGEEYAVWEGKEREKAEKLLMTAALQPLIVPTFQSASIHLGEFRAGLEALPWTGSLQDQIPAKIEAALRKRRKAKPAPRVEGSYDAFSPKAGEFLVVSFGHPIHEAPVA